MSDDHRVPETLHSVLLDWSKANPSRIPRLACFGKLLYKYVKAKGRTHVLTIFFPSIGKAFDKGLSSGLYSPVPIPFGNKPYGFRDRGSPSGIEPLLEIFFFERNGGFHLRSNICPNEVFFMRTLLNMYKKVKLESTKEVKEANVKEFFEIDHSLPRRSSTYDSLLKSISVYFVPLLHPEFFKSRGKHCSSSVNRRTLEWEPRHGPGATVDTSRSRDKYFALRNFPRSLHKVFPPELYATHKEQAEIHVNDAEIPAKLETVPKTLDKTRVITVESTAKQFCQQAVRTFLLSHGTLHSRRCIDISNQEKSKEAAKLASIDGNTATVDLKSASDYLSLETVSTIFACNQAILDALLASRTTHVTTPCGNTVELKKFAGQGNACTFIVQSIVYAVISVAAYHLTYGLRPSKKSISEATKYIQVYGDDIILPSSCMLYLSRILQNEGLRINTTKTHHEGFFREACGGDYFHGYDVTPLYLPSFDVRFKGKAKDEPELLQSLCEVSNNAYRKGLWTCCKCIRDSLPRYVHVYNIPGSLGFYSYLSYQTGKRTRWNEDIQVQEVLAHYLVAEKEFEESEAIYGRLYKYFVEKPSQDHNWEGRLTVRITLVVRPVWSVGYPHEVRPL